MKSADWKSLLQRAVERGILPAEALDTPSADFGQSASSAHPWPIVLLSAFGAYLASMPFIGFVLMLFGESLQRGIGPYVFGPLIGVAACVVLRSKRLALFVENLALIGLFVGTGLLYYGVMRDLGRDGYVICALISLALAVIVPVNWVRAILGGVAASLFYGFDFGFFRADRMWYIALLQTGTWAFALWAQRNVLVRSEQAGIAIALEWILVGWIMQVVSTFALLSGMSLIAGGVLGGSGMGGGITGEIARSVVNEAARGWHRYVGVQPLLSAAAACAAGAWATLRWPASRSPAGIGLVVVLAALSWFMPSLGPVVAIGVVTLLTRRTLQAGACAFAAAWIIGSFYYSLHWDLVTKAQVLIVAGIVLGVLAWVARQPARTSPHRQHHVSRPALALIALAALATFGVLNVGIWQKEDIIAHGRPVFVKLAPVDPRSLMQGDYMALNFEMTAEMQHTLANVSRLERQHAVASVDAKGIATLTRLTSTAPPANGEIQIELIPKNGHWIVVSDAWFFKEGDGQRWNTARYGEFRVKPDGRALLVGMADENLTRIGR